MRIKRKMSQEKKIKLDAAIDKMLPKDNLNDFAIPSINPYTGPSVIEYLQQIQEQLNHQACMINEIYVKIDEKKEGYRGNDTI